MLLATPFWSGSGSGIFVTLAECVRRVFIQQCVDLILFVIKRKMIAGVKREREVDEDEEEGMSEAFICLKSV